MTIKRRNILKYIGLVGGFLLFPVKLLAEWPASAFKAETLQDAISKLNNSGVSSIETDKLNLKVPAIAENGALVPVTVSTDMDGIMRLSIIVEKNPNPLVADFELTSNAVPAIKIRVKMAETSNVIALAQTRDRLYTRTQEVKVTLGGCDG